jgi:hypothetical protein
MCLPLTNMLRLCQVYLSHRSILLKILPFVCAILSRILVTRRVMGPSLLGLATISYCLRFETSFFIASHDSQGHGGGIRPRLHTGIIKLEQSRAEQSRAEQSRAVAYCRQPAFRCSSFDKKGGVGLFYSQITMQIDFYVASVRTA